MPPGLSHPVVLALGWLVVVLPLLAAPTALIPGQPRKAGTRSEFVAYVSTEKEQGALVAHAVPWGPGEHPRVRQGSVRHFTFSGRLPVQDSSDEAVTVHVYIKSLAKGGGKLAFRGVMFAESVERDWYSYLDGYVCQPDVAHEHWPDVLIREGDSIVEHPLRVYTESIWGHQADKPAPGTGNYNRKCMPYPFQGEVAVQSPASDFHLRLEGFRKTVVYFPGRVAALQQPGMQQHLRSRLPVPVAMAAPVGGDAKRASIILYPFTLQVAQDVANALLYHFLRYHVHLGFHVFQYSQPMHLAGFLADEALRAYVRAGQLELVLWDHLGECDGPPHMRCWQPIVYSHAILEAWGQPNIYLLIADADEYFVLPTPSTELDDVLRKCTDNKTQVTIQRYDAFSGGDPAVYDPMNGDPALRSAVAKQEASMGETDLSLWLRRALSEPHPLTKYRWRSARPIALGKNMVNPNNMASYEVHNGISFSVEQEEDKLAMNPKCAILLHMVNLFAHRYEPDHQMVRESTWQWVFRGLS